MSYTLTVGGISMPVIQDTIQIQKALTFQVDTFKCTIHSPTKPNEGDEVIVTDSELGILFGGIIVNVRLADKDAQLWEIDCNDYTELVDRKLVVEGYENLSASDIVKDIIAKYCTEDLLDDVTPGAPVVENILFNYVRPSQCFKDLCDYVGWQWYIDETKHIKFFDPAAVMVPAPFDLTEETRGLWGDFKLTVDMKNLRNRVYVLGGTMLSDPQTVEWKADGVARIWTLPWGPHEVIFKVGEVLKTVGVENLHDEEDFDYMMSFSEKYIRCSAHTTTPTEGTTMTLTAKQDIPVITTVEDYASQQAIAAVQGGDGVYEHCITDESLTTVQAAEAAGLSDLRAAANPKVSGSFLTAYAADWQPGQIIKVNLPDRGIDNVYMIQSVRLHYAATWFWTIEFGGRLLGIADFLQALVSSQQKKRNIEPTINLHKYVYSQETLALSDTLETNVKEMPYIIAQAIHRRIPITRHEATGNLIALAKQDFSNWSAYGGATVTVTQGQTVEEWLTDSATRIQINGGTNTLKYYTNAISQTILDQKYAYGVKIKNIGAFPVRVQVGFNLSDPTGVTVNPGETVWVKVEDITGNGTNSLQLQFRTLSVGNNLDFYAYQPQAEEKAYCTPFTPGIRTEDEFLSELIGTIGSKLRINSVGSGAWPQAEVGAGDVWTPIDFMRSCSVSGVISLKADRECDIDLYNYKEAFVESDAVCGMVVISDADDA